MDTKKAGMGQKPHSWLIMVIPPRGVELKNVNTDNSITYESHVVKGWPETWPDGAETVKISPELLQIIQNWKSLPEDTRQAITKLVDNAAK